MDYNLQNEKIKNDNIINFKYKTGLPKIESDIKDKLPQKEDWTMMEFLENQNINISKNKK